MRTIATIGATFSGNKGAASMLQSLLDNVPPLLDDEVRFLVLTVYPVEDTRLVERNRLVEIVAARPVALLIAVPFAPVWSLLRSLGLPPAHLLRSPLLEALEHSELLVDLSGISFSDGRRIELVYNIACVLPAILMGKRVVKYSQAMGPFKTRVNRTAARALLPRLALCIARGRISAGHLKELGLTNVEICADAAFSMAARHTDDAAQHLSASEWSDSRRVIGIAVSSVVRAYCTRRGIEYMPILAGFSDKAIEHGYAVRLIAHSVRESQTGGRTDDVDACRSVHTLVKRKERCQLVVEDLSPSTLRMIIGGCDFVIASRFHAMVSALATGVPTIVTGWGHKYREVLEMFDLEEWAVGYETLSVGGLWDTFRELVTRETEIRKKIVHNLDGVVASSHRNALLAASLLAD
jgi:polysaccharide pyruvyl transferase WcaK-like protein